MYFRHQEIWKGCFVVWGLHSMSCYVSLVENRTRGCHIGVSALERINHWSSWSEAHGQDTPKWSRTVVGELQPTGHIHCSMFLQIKFYWKTVTLIYVYIVCGFTCTKLTELNSDNRGPVVHKAKNIYYLPLSRKQYCQVLAFIWLFFFFIMGIL